MGAVARTVERINQSVHSLVRSRADRPCEANDVSLGEERLFFCHLKISRKLFYCTTNSAAKLDCMYVRTWALDIAIVLGHELKIKN